MPGLPRAKCAAFHASLVPLVGGLLLVAAAFGARARDVLRPRLLVLLRQLRIRLLGHAQVLRVVGEPETLRRDAGGDRRQFLEQSCDCGGIELRPRTVPQLRERRLERELLAVDAIVRHRVVRVGDEDDPRTERNVIAVQAIGVAAPVPPLVMVKHPLRDGIDSEALEHAVTDLRMTLEDESLAVRERTRLAEDLL